MMFFFLFIIILFFVGTRYNKLDDVYFRAGRSSRSKFDYRSSSDGEKLLLFNNYSYCALLNSLRLGSVDIELGKAFEDGRNRVSQRRRNGH